MRTLSRVLVFYSVLLTALLSVAWVRSFANGDEVSVSFPSASVTARTFDGIWNLEVSEEENYPRIVWSPFFDSAHVSGHEYLEHRREATQEILTTNCSKSHQEWAVPIWALAVLAALPGLRFLLPTLRRRWSVQAATTAAAPVQDVNTLQYASAGTTPISTVQVSFGSMSLIVAMGGLLYAIVIGFWLKQEIVDAHEPMTLHTTVYAVVAVALAILHATLLTAGILALRGLDRWVAWHRLYANWNLIFASAPFVLLIGLSKSYREVVSEICSTTELLLICGSSAYAMLILMMVRPNAGRVVIGRSGGG